LKCVDWTDPAETKASVQLMHEWAPIGPATALELLTPSFTNSDVRRYAVAILAQVDDEELLLYLLQLVQVRMRLQMRDHARLKFPREHHLFNYLSTDHYLITGATL
jgi:phosphatidylinositol 3-kinase